MSKLRGCSINEHIEPCGRCGEEGHDPIECMASVERALAYKKFKQGVPFSQLYEEIKNISIPSTPMPQPVSPSANEEVAELKSLVMSMRDISVDMGTREHIVRVVVDVDDEDRDEAMGDDIDLDLEEDVGGVTQVNQPEIDGDKRSETKEVLETLSTLLKDYSQVGKQSGVGNVNDVGANDIPLGRNERLKSFDSWMSKRPKVLVEKSEIDLYLEEKNHDYNVPLDILDYWKGASSKFPQLATLARDVLAIPISSVPSESAFSMGKKLINPWRASLTSDTIESLACYEDWLRAKNFSLRSSILGKIDDDADDALEI
ncbi:uncharacterized protein LOC141655169 [Silene latifolia]|uniref:uncharacterized protein LOC141655169 n=1 Tax=Silene latifolia TaxID=37657 RepID=UPI003D77D005